MLESKRSEARAVERWKATYKMVCQKAPVYQGKDTCGLIETSSLEMHQVLLCCLTKTASA